MNRETRDTQITMEPLLLSRDEAAAALGGISTSKLDELYKAGRINPRVLDGRVMFAPDELRRFAAECPAWEPAK